MKHVRKALALMLATFVALIVAAPVFADDYSGTSPAGQADAKITITNADAVEYKLYRIFEATLDPTDQTKINYKMTEAQWNTIDGDATAKAFFEANMTKTPIDSNDLTKGYYVGQLPAAQGQTQTPLEQKVGTDEFKTFAKLVSGTTPLMTINNADADGNIKNPSIEFNKIPYGWYFLESGTNALITVDSTTPTATVIDKNTEIEVFKWVQDADGNWVELNEAAIDQEINFKVNAATQNVDGGKDVMNYTITDEMYPGFSLKAAPTSIKVGSQVLTEAADPTDPKQNEYVITYSAKGTAVTDPTKADSFEIFIPWAEQDATTKAITPFFGMNDQVEILYTAKLDSAKVKDIKQDEPNGNTVSVTDNVYDPITKKIVPGGSSPQDRTDTYDTGIHIKKYKEDGTTPMSGAGFTLTKKSGNAYGPFVAGVGNSITTAESYVADPQGDSWLLTAKGPNGEDKYTTDDPTVQTQDTTVSTYPWAIDIGVYAEFDPTKPYDQQTPDTWTRYKKVTTTSDLVAMGPSMTAGAVAYGETNDTGDLYFTGLASGEYKIEETKVPTGYVKADDIYVKIEFDNDSANAYANPHFVLYKSTDKGATYDTANPVNITATTGLFDLPITNLPGTEFPETGGMGTRILYTVGGLMVAGAAIYLITKKRMASEA